jgi:hypothetical protein
MLNPPHMNSASGSRQVRIIFKRPAKRAHYINAF